MQQPAEFFRRAAEQAGTIFFCVRISPDVAVEYLSDQIVDLLGHPAGQFAQDPDLFRSRIAANDDAVLSALLSGPLGEPSKAQLTWIHRDGHTVHTRVTGATRQRDDGSVVFEGAAQPVTELHEIQAALSATQEHFRLMAENASDIVFKGHPREGLDWISPSVTDVLGWEPEEVLGTLPDFLVHPDDLSQIVAAVTDIRDGRRVEFVVRLRRKDGSYMWSQMSIRVVLDSAGAPVVISGARDIDAEYRARQELQRSEQLFRTAMSSAAVGMAVLDLDRRFVEVNAALCRMLEREESWLLRHRIDDVLAASELAVDQQLRERVIAGTAESPIVEQRFVTGSGVTIWIDHAIGLARDHEGNPMSFVSSFDDITEDIREWDELQFAAKHDPLTDLVNRTELMAQVESRLSERKRDPGAQLGVLYIDVDGLKPVNDTYGHATGDDVLTAIAQRIRQQVRQGDVVARVGGDEIVVALPGIHGLSEAEFVAAKIKAAMAAPIHSHGHSLVVTVSVGVASGAADADPEHLLRQADAALYRAKHEGRNRVVSDSSELI